MQSTLAVDRVDCEIEVLCHRPVTLVVLSLESISTMFMRVLSIAVLVLALPRGANSQTWSTPDGFLSITPPDASEFQPIPEPPPPFVGLWVSNDETMKFGVMQTQIPPNVKLIQSSAEEGLAKEIGGEVTRLPTKQVSGHEVWTMTGKNASVEITQALIRHEGAGYKLMALTVGGNPDAAAVTRFMDSLSIAQPFRSMVEPSKQSDAQPVQDLDRGVDLDELSKKIGGAGALLGIGLLVYFLTRAEKNRET